MAIVGTRNRKDSAARAANATKLTRGSRVCPCFSKDAAAGREKPKTRLHRSKAQYRLLFERNPIPMWVFDRATLRFLAVNEAAIRKYGYSEQEFLGLSIADIRPHDTIAQLREHVARHESGLQPPELWQHRRKDGSSIDVEVVCHDLDFQGIDAMLVAAYDVTERERAKKLLEETENRYHVMFEQSPDPFWLMDEKGFVDCNAAGLALFGYSKKSDFVDPAGISPPFQPDGSSSRVAAAQRTAAAFRNGNERFEWVHLRKNGEPFLADISLAALKLNGRPMLLASARDISDRKRAEEALLFKNALLEAQSETTLDGILVVDQAAKIVMTNRQFRLQFRIPDWMIEQKADRPMLEYAAGQMEDCNAFLERVKYLYNHPDEKSRDELRFKDGRTFDRYSAPLIDSNGQQRGRIWYFRDITDRKAAEARAEHLAYYDALTDLPNRTLLRDRLEIALAGARRRNEQIALLFLDLDRFKIINDSLGRSFGDQVLKEVAQRLKQILREQDTVSRIGSDEFVVILNEVHDLAEAGITAGRIKECIAQPFEIQGRKVSATCSIGISIFPQYGADAENLFRSAEAAVHSAKEDGRDTFRFFSQEMNSKVANELAMENALRTALSRNEFFLVYQPQLDLASGRITGLEALIRWKHPDLGIVPPDRFIRTAENSGLILPIGEWVLRTACAQAAKWRSQGLCSVPVAVNVSAVQFRKENFCALIRQVFKQARLDPEYLELELTESLLFANADRTRLALSELDEMGVQLAIDDFGTGYSNLSYLKQFPVDKIKIDRSFVRDLPTSAQDVAITTAIISMAKSLNLKVLAEGVETEEQMSFLREHQCDEIQGFYFCRPGAEKEVSILLAGDLAGENDALHPFGTPSTLC